MGVATGCGLKEIYRFPHIPIIISLYSICTFLQQHPYFFVHLKKCIYVMTRIKNFTTEHQDL